MSSLIFIAAALLAEPADTSAAAEPAPAEAQPAAEPQPRPLQRSRHTIEDLDWCRPTDPGCPPRPASEVPELAPASRQPLRSPAGAAALGFLVGFGTGQLYAGDDTRGISFAVADSVLWIGLASTMTLFTQLVVENDFEKEKSLKRGEREMGERERRLYATSWVLGAALVLSHAYQGFTSLSAARAANRLPGGVAVLPTDGGALVLVGF